ncbi:ankyrin repeat and SOCS box protein 12-like [Neocloeon triangulifer]|uniref:ankyrin repeat and SOCS box protein 12-like n=1 Tax=Neocloeon triangulifer TaxID=2078957 RepID=UPI00286F79DE|nr:ankyrin repeat and SOCS box protein 12-like [Neocloeon triangulifer]
MLQAIQVHAEAVQDNYESLHALSCQASAEDIRAMSDKMHEDPESLHRICMPLLTTPLHHAAARGHNACLHFLLGKGARPNIEDRTGCTPLETAISHNHEDCVRALLAHGADPNFQSESNFRQSRTRCLTKACMDGKINIVKMLLEAGAVVDDVPPDAPDYLLLSPCSFAVTYGNPEILRLLLFHGAVTDLGQLPECSDRHLLVLKHLLPHLAVAHKMRNGYEATRLTIEILRKFGADFCKKDQYGKAPKQIIQILKNSHICDQFDDKIDEYLDECACPLPLKDLSRVNLVRNLKTRYFDVIPNLNIPRSLKQFLNDI